MGSTAPSQSASGRRRCALRGGTIDPTFRARLRPGSNRLAQARKHRSLGLRAVSEATGISPAKLSRFESKEGNPDIDTLLRLVDWLELERSDVFAAAAAATADTPGVVEVHLQADPRRQALAEGFRIMYERFTQDEPERPVPRDARRG